jgi:thymidylate kinase
MLYRIETEVIPAMKQWHIVILDRGICTLIVRGMLIGMPEASIRTGLLWWRNSIYRELFDKAINISVTIWLAESLKRLQKRSKKQLQTPERAEGTLLTLHFINTLVYAPDGKKLTRNDRKQFISDAQAKIIDTYIHIYEAEQNVIHIDGGMSKKEIAKDIERQIVDSM